MLHDRLPSLSQMRQIGQGWDLEASTHAHIVQGPGENEVSDQVQRRPTHIRHGLKTPPEDMNGSNTNLLPAPFDGLQYKSVPVIGSNNTSYHTHHDTHATTRYTSKTQPFYDSYHSAQRSQSPTHRGESIGSREPPARRRASSDGNSIVSYLQIPSSINSSKGSLAEFAAQVNLNIPKFFEPELTLAR